MRTAAPWSSCRRRRTTAPSASRSCTCASTDRLPVPAARGALQGYRNRWSALRDAVLETEPTFREDLLPEVPTADLLVEPIRELADRWRSPHDRHRRRPVRGRPDANGSRAAPRRSATRVFTDEEQAYCDRRKDPTERYAARFAAKEAVMKAMGVGRRGLQVARDRGGQGQLRRALRAPPRRRTGAGRRASGSAGGGSRSPTPTGSPKPSPSRCDPDPHAGGDGGGRRGGAASRVEVLIERAGAAVAHEALWTCSGAATGGGSWCWPARGTTGPTVAPPRSGCGGGACGSRSSMPADAPARLPTADLVVDAAYGTGLPRRARRARRGRHAGARRRHPERRRRPDR